MKKKNITDLTTRRNMMANSDIHQDTEIYSDDGIQSKFMRKNKYGGDRKMNQDESELYTEDDTITVFDLVHRGRERNEQLQNLRRQATNAELQVFAPRIISPISGHVEGR